MKDESVDEVSVRLDDLERLVKLVSAGGAPGSQAQLRRMVKRYGSTVPGIGEFVVGLLKAASFRGANGGDVTQPLDNDSRIPLVRTEDPVVIQQEPILDTATQDAVAQVVFEHSNPDKMAAAGLAPSRTILFVGDPGVGKTLTARWIAAQLNRPLITLDLSSVMSSYLGRTGMNVRRVLDFARAHRCVLLLDELDAVAKRRDDAGEIGELKRLVTVLLQEIDSWPEGALMVAATNHADLLDPAVWRRFDVIVNFERPPYEAILSALTGFLEEPDTGNDCLELIAHAYAGETLSSVERDVLAARRQSVKTGDVPLVALESEIRRRYSILPRAERVVRAVNLKKVSGASQRRVSELTGVSRDTLRKNAVGESSKGATR